MSAYDYIDQSRPGLLYGIDNKIEGSWACKEVDGIEFGYPVFSYVGDEKDLYHFYKDTGKIVFDADFVTSNTIDITVNGESMDTVTFTTDHDTTAGLVVDALNAMDGVEAVLDTDDSDNRTFLILVKGATAVVTEAVAAGASQADGTITYTTSQVYVGIAAMTQNSAGLYEQYDAVNVLTEGTVWAQCSTAAAANMGGYVADAGKVANSGVSIGITFRSNLSAAGYVLVQTSGQSALGEAVKFA